MEYNIMRELNVNEIEQTNGGLVFVAPFALKAVTFAVSAVAGAASAAITEHYVSYMLK